MPAISCEACTEGLEVTFVQEPQSTELLDFVTDAAAESGIGCGHAHIQALYGLLQCALLMLPHKQHIRAGACTYSCSIQDACSVL